MYISYMFIYNIHVICFPFLEMASQNPMRNISITKLIVHTCVGGENDALTKASKVLTQLTG